MSFKFKVGDKVKFVGDYSKHSIYFGKKLEDFIKENKNVLYVSAVTTAYIQVRGSTFWCFSDGELELVDYTYEDLKKSPIGAKITFEDGKVLVKVKERDARCDEFTNGVANRNTNDLKNLKDSWLEGYFGKIIKIEEPEYRTVYEAKVEILDEVEKRYLRGVIRPYSDRIESIEKFIFSTGRAKITITVKDGNDYWYINLPPFEKDTMYKNMKDDEQYTLEELGL